MPRRILSIIGLSLATLVLALGGASWVVGGTAWLTTPWQRWWASGGPDSERDQLLQQVVRLNAENAMLRSRLDQYRRIAGEGNFPPIQVAVARGRIVGRTARAGRRYVELDAGAGDGVVRDLPACDGWALAGMVTGLTEGRGLVQEITDSESRIPAAIIAAGKVLAEGVLAGSGDPRECRLDFIEPRDDLRIEAGMQVVTAGSDGRLPPGMVLGGIVRAVRGIGAEHWRILVRPAAATATVESLLILRVPERPATVAAEPGEG
jgi:cell shape-determining protein MreC